MSDTPESGSSQIIIYQAEDGNTRLEVRLEQETVWLTQKMMAELFQVSVPTINEHIKNINNEAELMPEATIRKFRIVQKEGQRTIGRMVDFYNLDMIISVGYRVKSRIATRFRQWATQRLREYIVKGFVLDDERLKNPDQPFDYFDELLRRIQDIRTSEKRFYQKITDIYATSVDYDPTLPISIDFFKTVQNKLHWAITGKTAAEIIHERADSEKPRMGLTNWRGTKVRKTDVFIAKNYLDKDELRALNNMFARMYGTASHNAPLAGPALPLLCVQNSLKPLPVFLQQNRVSACLESLRSSDRDTYSLRQA
ncbi:MAG: virulence RhuM family protein [Deltaproteobacteria bacterium]|nr:virulence RhuM family protein [Deltaproteobacteria bacterium]